MRKKIMLLLLVCICLLTGCSGVQAEFWTKIQESMLWEGSRTAQSGVIVIELGAERVEIHIDAQENMNKDIQTGYTETLFKVIMSKQFAEELFAEQFFIGQHSVVTSQWTEEVDGVGTVEKVGVDINVKTYTQDGQVYLHRSFFEQYFELSGVALPDTFNLLDGEYIRVPEQMSNEAKRDFYEILFSLSNIQIPVQKYENTYSITLNNEEIVPIVTQFVDNSIGQVGDIMDVTGGSYTQDERASVEVDTVEKLQALKEEVLALQEYMAVTFQWDTSYSDNSISEVLEIHISPKAEMKEYLELLMGGEVSIHGYIEQKTQKEARQEIAVPSIADMPDEVFFAFMHMEQTDK